METLREVFSEQQTLYDRLVKEMEHFANRLGGWKSADGTELDGKLWELSKKITAERHFSA